jgi:hypothetical protein
MTQRSAEIVSRRALNRATLARQGLIDRLPAGTSVEDAVDAVGPLQSQYNPSPFVALRARVDGFGRDDLRRALDELRVVKASLTRGTLHVVSAARYPWYASVSDRMAVWHKLLGATVDVEALRAELLAYIDDGPRPLAELTDFITTWMHGHKRPGAELPSSSSWSVVRTYPWLVRTPETTRLDAHPRDGYLTARRALPGAEEEGAIDADQAFAQVVRWYLAAFGPAEADDIKSFFLESRISRVRSALATLGDEVIELAGEGGRDGQDGQDGRNGRVFYDLVDAPRPGSDVEVPVRFLARFDSLLLGQASPNRVRVLPEPFRSTVFQTRNGQVLSTFLVDGMVAGTWDWKTVRRRGRLTITPLARLSKSVRAEVEAEAAATAAFLAAEGDEPDIVFDNGAVASAPERTHDDDL